MRAAQRTRRVVVVRRRDYRRLEFDAGHGRAWRRNFPYAGTHWRAALSGRAVGSGASPALRDSGRPVAARIATTTPVPADACANRLGATGIRKDEAMVYRQCLKDAQ